MEMKLRNLVDGKPSRKQSVIKAAQFNTPLGSMTACATETGICLLEFSDSSRLPYRMDKLKRRSGMPVVSGRHILLTQLKTETKEYFKRDRKKFDVPIVLDGTMFQKNVWEVLSRSKYGETLTYSELALRADKAGAIRAAAAANGANALSILIPCHRVVAANGNLTGYSGGIERKASLLELEAS